MFCLIFEKSYVFCYYFGSHILRKNFLEYTAYPYIQIIFATMHTKEIFTKKLLFVQSLAVVVTISIYGKDVSCPFFFLLFSLCQCIIVVCDS